MGKASTFFSDETDKSFGVRDEGHKLAPTVEVVESRLKGTKRDLAAKRIELSCIIAKEQVRTNFDEDDLKELAHSLKTLGQQQPILVYWSEEEAKYVIIAGERRFRAAKFADMKVLDCKVHPYEPSEAELVELQFVENAIRTDLNPIEEAISYKRLGDLNGMSANELAKRIGKAQSTVSRSLRLLKLPENIQKDIGKGKIPTSIAREIGKLQLEDEQQKMAEQYLAGTLTTKQAQASTSTSSKKSTKYRTNKTKTVDDLKVVMTSKKRLSQIEIAERLRALADVYEGDGRAKRAA